MPKAGRLLSHLHRETYPAGSFIFRQGDPGDCAYLIEEGCVEVSVNGVAQAQLRKGELFGEVALLDKQPRTGTVRATENAVVIPIPRVLVGELLQKTDPVVRHLLLIILERFRSVYGPSGFEPTRTTAFMRDSTRSVATQHLTLGRDMLEALHEGQFELFYQPICELSGGRPVGFEALVRWHHPTAGTISPLDFLGLAEQMGQIHQIGLWTLERACLDWPVLRARIDYPRPFVSVNLSPSQLAGEGFVRAVKEIVHGHGMSPIELKLEMTETVVIDRPERALELLGMLTQMGSTLALDDFGTGYSSLDALHRYPFGTMKIDRCFIGQMLGTPRIAKIVHSSIELAHALNMDVVAEGVETEAERSALGALGCDYGQGWLFGRPASLKAIETSVR